MSIKKAYNSWASQYDTNENKTRDLDKIATINTLSKFNFSRVLELGCGSGKNTEWLVQHAEKVVGLDFSDKMLSIAKKKVISPKVSFIKTDLNLNWEIPDNYVDLATCSLTLEHIENLNHIFEQSFLKLKKDGLFFICELHPLKQYLGSKARYESEEGTQELEVFTHHLTDYITVAQKNGFEVSEINEWFDEGVAIPRLISFVFKK